MKIAILDDYQDVVKDLSCFKLLKDHDTTVLRGTHKSEDELVEQLQDQDAAVLIRERTLITQELLTKLPRLKLLSQTGKVSNHIDLQACSRHGVAVAEGVGSPIAPAELCWTLIMAASRHLGPYTRNLRQGRWQDADNLGLGRKLYGRTLGIWGYGKIGQRIARYGEAFGMKVMIWGHPASRERAVADGFTAAASKKEFFELADVLTLHLRLNEETSGCVTYADLQLMKPDALFVNTSRDGLIENDALRRSLLAGSPGQAALDVFSSEPVAPEQDFLLTMPNVLCSPHLGYVERDSYELYFKAAFENVVNFFAGQPANIANPEILNK